jgi:small ligand-binding sensory domain FIST
LFDEPLNAVSNIAFVIAAWAAWRDAKRSQCLTPGVWLLVVLSLSVGIGSALWHTFATQWAMVLDVVPIMLFQFSFLWLYGRWVAGLRPLVVGFVLVIYAGVGFWLAGFDQWLNGVLVYVPTLALAWITGLHFHRSQRSRRFLLLASAMVFSLALVCRSLDLIVCRQLPIGTHFLWHALNGVVVFQCSRR